MTKFPGSPLFNVLRCFLIIGALFSCNSNGGGDSYYTKVFDTADQLDNSGKRDEAIRYVDVAFARQGQAGPYHQYRRYFRKKQYYFYDRHMPDSNDVYVDSMLYALESGNIAAAYPTEYAQTLNAKGDYYYNANDFDKAFEFYYRSRMAAQDTCAYANQTYHLGMVTYRQEKYNEAVNYFQQSLIENRSCGRDSIAFYRVQELYNNIALCYTQQKKYDSANLYYGKALDYITTESKQYGAVVRKFSEMAAGVIYGNVAKLFIYENKPDTAEQLLIRSIAINSRPGYDNTDALLAKVQLAELYNNSSRFPAAFALLSQVKAASDSLPNPQVELKRRFLLYKYYTGIGQSALAFDQLRNYTLLKDSLSAASTTLNQTNVNQFVKNLETEYRLKLLTKDNELNRLYLAITIGLSLLTILVIILVYLNYRKTKENVQKLTVLNYRINEQKDQLEYAMTELQKINREKDRILYVVAHDLKNPMSGILALSEAVMSDEMDESHKRSLEVINNTSHNSLKLINKLLEIGVDNIQQNVTEGDVTELNELTGQVTALLHFQANTKKQRLVLNLSAEPVNAQAIKDKIWRVISNLVSNAIKFSPEGGTIEVIVSQSGDRARVAVKDHGIGIPEDLQPFVFDMFTSAKRLGTYGEGAFGLGLSICRQIIETHNGNIWFESTPGKGTTFYFEIPLAA
ncbi:MAG: ATP-binding protein [Bacteroidota bacterium]